MALEKIMILRFGGIQEAWIEPKNLINPAQYKMLMAERDKEDAYLKKAEEDMKEEAEKKVVIENKPVFKASVKATFKEEKKPTHYRGKKK